MRGGGGSYNNRWWYKKGIHDRVENEKESKDGYNSNVHPIEKEEGLWYKGSRETLW